MALNESIVRTIPKLKRKQEMKFIEISHENKQIIYFQHQVLQHVLLHSNQDEVFDVLKTKKSQIECNVLSIE